MINIFKHFRSIFLLDNSRITPLEYTSDFTCLNLYKSIYEKCNNNKK